MVCSTGSDSVDNGGSDTRPSIERIVLCALTNRRYIRKIELSANVPGSTILKALILRIPEATFSMNRPRLSALMVEYLSTFARNMVWVRPHPLLRLLRLLQITRLPRRPRAASL